MLQSRFIKLIGIILSVAMLAGCGKQKEDSISVTEDLNSSIGYYDSSESGSYETVGFLPSSSDIYDTQEESEIAKSISKNEPVSDNAVLENSVSDDVIEETIESAVELEEETSEASEEVVEEDSYNNYYDYEDSDSSSSITGSRAEYYEVDDDGDEYTVTIIGAPETIDFDIDVYYTHIVNHGLGYSINTEDEDVPYEIQNIITGVEFSRATLTGTPSYDNPYAIHFYSKDDSSTSLTVYNNKLIKYKGNWYYAEDGEIDTGALENICEEHENDELTEE